MAGVFFELSTFLMKHFRRLLHWIFSSNQIIRFVKLLSAALATISKSHNHHLHDGDGDSDGDRDGDRDRDGEGHLIAWSMFDQSSENTLTYKHPPQNLGKLASENYILPLEFFSPVIFTKDFLKPPMA